MSLASAALVSAETILALTPIAIKKTPLNPTAAIWSRILSTAAIGYGITGDRTLPQSEWTSAGVLGYTNLLHVASSYEAFRHLPAGQAMSLLYTYPFWNLLLASGSEAISAGSYGCIAAASVGSILLNLDPGVAAESAIKRTVNPTWGVFMGLVMALTESGMITLLKDLNWRDPAKSVWVVNTSASVWFGLALIVQGLLTGSDRADILESGTWWDAAVLTAFHSVTMFSGYWLRYYAIPRLSTVSFAILSYAGLLASYMFGLVIVGERPGWMSVVGAAIIVGSGLALRFVK